MDYNRDTLPILGLIVLLNFGSLASESDAPPPARRVAVFDLSVSLPEEPGQLNLTTVAFSSDGSIVVGICRTGFQGPQRYQYEIRWENGSYGRAVQTKAAPVWGGRSSADGSRKLFELSKRRVPFFQHVMETLGTLMTLGMSGPEDVNRETVRVIDTATRKSCFEWNRIFPMDWRRGRFATISPSGKLVAVTVENTVSIYLLPAVCEGPTKVRVE